MKIVHTSDWHVGRRWKGIQHLDEMEAVLEHLGDFIEKESVDLVLHTRDIFDSRNPPAEAERLVNRFFVRIGRVGAHMIVIAGNHDDPSGSMPDRFSPSTPTSRSWGGRGEPSRAARALSIPGVVRRPLSPRFPSPRPGHGFPRWTSRARRPAPGASMPGCSSGQSRTSPSRSSKTP